jgi:polyvinyl alcohol dehydrogenase (cytochrome)
MRYVCLLLLSVGILSAQDGAAVYKERCASCHDAPTGRVPALSSIKAMSGEAIYAALTSGAMKTQAEGLSTPQIFMLLGYIVPTGGAQTAAPKPITKTCTTATPSKTNAAQWNGWSTSVANTRFQDRAAAGLKADDLPKLKLKWALNLGAVTMSRSQPVVVGNRAYIASYTGAVYSLDTATGCTHWGFNAAAAVRSGVTLGEVNGKSAVFFADAGANVHALNAETGALLWKIRPVDNFATMATAAPQFYKGIVYLGFSSFEEAIGPDPTYQCCTFRGSVVALDAATGKTIWQTFTIPEAAKPTKKSPTGVQQFGPSGAGVWSTPTIDEERGALYVSTGDNYSDPPTDTSDAVLAMDLKTGKLLWSQQLTKNDVYNNGCMTPQRTNCPETAGPDFDFGQPPVLVRLNRQKSVLAIAQKSGLVYGLDPDRKGAVIWQTRTGEGGMLGGSQWGSASDGQKMYVAISDVAIGGVADPKSPGGFRLVLDPKKGGGLHALDLATGKIQWSAKPVACAEGQASCSPAQSAAVTAIPGAVFSGSVDGHFRAYSSKTGKVIWDTDTAKEFPTVNGSPAHGGSIDGAGAAVVNGLVLVNSGYGQWGGMPGNVLLVYSIDGK